MAVREPAVAGTFYPADPTELQQLVDTLLADVPEDMVPPPAGQVSAVVAPHAGYVYSGRMAAIAYRQLRAEGISRVAIIGPSHRVGFTGIAIPEADAWRTPLGEVAVDVPDAVRALPGVFASDRAHAHEHSLEVHVPFVQTLFPGAPIAPLEVGDAEPGTVGAVVSALLADRGTLVIVSSDLSHYLPYDDANQVDAETLRAITDLQFIPTDRACGARPVNGLVDHALRHDERITLVAHENSGDTAGTKDRVVGYAALALLDDHEAPIPPEAPDVLLWLARRTLDQATGAAPQRPLDTASLPEFVHRPGATFVTLHLDGRLRGCIGSLEPYRPLLDDVVVNTRAAALRDPRFPAVTADEARRVVVEVSLLGQPQPMQVADELDAVRQLRARLDQGHRDGIILTAGGRRATYLPQVWDQLPDPLEFLRSLRQKAGLPPTYWGPDVRLLRYPVTAWEEMR